MNIRQNISSLTKKALKTPIRAVLVGGLVTLAAVTSLKDNVHFGSVLLHNPTGNHYTWGIFPTTYIEGDSAEGNFHTFGILFGRNKVNDSIQFNGGMSAYGLTVGENDVGDNSEVSGGMSAYGLFMAVNRAGDSSKINGGMSAYGLTVGGNAAGNNSEVSGGMSAYGLFIAVNGAGESSRITGDVVSRGIIAGIPFGATLGNDAHYNLKEKVVGKK